MPQTKAEKILYCLFFIPTLVFLIWLSGGGGGVDAALVWLIVCAFVNLLPTAMALGIYEMLTGDNASSVESNLEAKITSIQEALPKRAIRNRSANGGRSPWVAVLVFGAPAGGVVLILFLPDNPLIAGLIGCGLVYAIASAIINQNTRQ